MKKTIFAFLMLLTIATTLFAQDKIQKKDGTSLSVKLKEVSTTEAKFLKADNLTGPIFVLPLTDIDFIKYENGVIESYTHLKPKEDVSKQPNEVFYEKQDSKIVQSAPELKNGYVQGEEDAAIYYRKYRAAGGWTCATTILFSPIIGLIPAVATSLTPPAIHNLNAPNLEKLKNAEYNRGYTNFAKRKKRQRVWLNFGIGTAVWGILTIIGSSGG